ncbi:MAG TPA: alpha/beta hydrolase [Segetibacter sp.]
MKRFFSWLTIIVALLVVAYLLGPQPEEPEYGTNIPTVPAGAKQLEAYVKANEFVHKLKPDNEARIIWANDSTKQKTNYAIVYLHGFSASQAEGEPVHRNIAKKFGCNLYLSRLAGHGIDTTNPMIGFTASEYWESAKQALAIGRSLGNNVILMATSTGGTLALQLAATFPRHVAALVLLSPNIAINNDKAYLLNNPWGLQIAKLVTGADAITAKDSRTIYKKYWYHHYRYEPTVELEELLETTMTRETFARVKQPALLLYYYKDAIYQDSVVSVPAMLTMFNQLGTAPENKIKKAMPKAGNHVIGSYIKSEDVQGVQHEVEDFMEKVIKVRKQEP